MFAARVLRAPIWLLLSALLARLLRPDGLGAWAMILSAAMLANQVFFLWTQSITQRFGRSEWLETRQLDQTWSLRWPLLAGGMLVIVVVLVGPSDWHGPMYGLSELQRWLIVPVLVALWWMGEAQGLQQVQARFAVMAWSPLVADAVLVVVVSLLLAAAATGRPLLGPDGNLGAVAMTGTAVWAAILARELRGMRLRWWLPSGEAQRRALVFAAPLVPGYAIGYLAEWCDYWLIGYFYDAHAVGIFHVAYQYMLVLVGMPAAAAVVLLPQAVAAIDRAGESSLHEFVGRFAPQLIALWALATLALLPVMPWLFGVLTGSRFVDGQVVLQVLLIAVPGAIATHVYGVAHFAQGRLGTANIGLFGVKLFVNFAVSIALLPTLGVVGSAVGSAVSYLVLQWLFLFDQHRHLHIPFGSAARVLVLAHAAGIALAFTPNGPWRLVVAAAALVVLVHSIRRRELFSPAEVSALMPARLKNVVPAAARMLCRES